MCSNARKASHSSSSSSHATSSCGWNATLCDVNFTSVTLPAGRFISCRSESSQATTTLRGIRQEDEHKEDEGGGCGSSSVAVHWPSASSPTRIRSTHVRGWEWGAPRGRQEYYMEITRGSGNGFRVREARRWMNKEATPVRLLATGYNKSSTTGSK